MEDSLRLAFQVFTRRLRRLRWLVFWPLRARLSRLLPSRLIPRGPPTAFAHLLVCRRPGFALLWLDFVLLGPSAAAACCARLRFTGREDVFHFLLLEALPQMVEVLGVYRAKLVSWSKGLLPAPAPGISTSGTSFIHSACRGQTWPCGDAWVNSGLLSRSCAWSA